MEENDYFSWLISNINCDVNQSEYTDLLEYLYIKDFEWLPEIELDGNREIAGLELRNKFLDDLPDDYYYEFQEKYSDIPCSILEMFVALSIDLGRLISCDTDEPGRIFWLMMDNMGLKKYNNLGFNVECVDELLNNFLTRTYLEKNGTGAPFFVPEFSKYYSEFRNYDLYRQGSIYLGQYFGKI